MKSTRTITLPSGTKLEVDFTDRFEELVRHHLKMKKQQKITDRDISTTIYNCFSAAIKQGVIINEET